MKAIKCSKCELSFLPYYLRAGMCNGCRNPHLIVEAIPNGEIIEITKQFDDARLGALGHIEEMLEILTLNNAKLRAVGWTIDTLDDMLKKAHDIIDHS